MTLLPAAAGAHHILGIPHYAYDDQYPQTPVLTYRVDAGSNEVKMTGYPGAPKPGEPCSLHVYIRDRLTGAPFDGSVRMSVMRKRLLGPDAVVYGPVTASREEAVYKFYPRFESEASYVVRVAFDADGAPWVIDLPMVVGEPASPWPTVIASAATVLVLLIVVRAVRIKRRRRQQIAGRSPGRGKAAPSVPPGAETSEPAAAS